MTITSIKKEASNLCVGNIIGADVLKINAGGFFFVHDHADSLPHDKAIINVQLPITLVIETLAVLFGTFGKLGFRRWPNSRAAVIQLITLEKSRQFYIELNCTPL